MDALRAILIWHAIAFFPQGVTWKNPFTGVTTHVERDYTPWSGRVAIVTTHHGYQRNGVWCVTKEGWYRGAETRVIK